MSTDIKASQLSLSVLRIYLRRPGARPGRTFWTRFFGRALSYELAERALKAGVAYATVTLGHAGFAPGSVRMGVYAAEASPTTLPACVELVARVDVLEAFVSANRDELTGAVLLRIDGAHVTLHGELA